MPSRKKKIELLEEAWKDLPTAIRNTIINIYGGLNNLEESELNKFYDTVINDNNRSWKRWTKEQEASKSEYKSATGSVGNALERAAESLGLNLDDLTTREEKELTPTDKDTGKASPEMKKRASPKSELPESVLKYVNNYKKQYIDSQKEMLDSPWSKVGQMFSEKKMASKEDYLYGGIPQFKARDKDRMAAAANVSIANLEMDLQEDILELEQLVRKKNELKKWNGTNKIAKELTESTIELGQRIKTLQTGLADMYFEANIEILKNDVFTEIDGKYYLNDSGRTILIPEETIQELAKRQDNIISSISLLKNSIVSGTPKRAKEFNSVNDIPGMELSESDKLLVDFDRRIKHSGFIHDIDINLATLDEIEIAKHHWKMAGEMAGSGKAVVTTEVASNTLIDMGDLGVIEVQRDPKFEQGGRANELGVVGDIGDRASLEEEMILRDLRNQHPVFNFSGSARIQMEEFGWFAVDKDGNVTPVNDAKTATNIGEALENLQKNPKGAEIVKFLGLEHFTRKEWIEKNQNKTGLTADDLMKKRIRSEIPLGTTDEHMFGKPLKQGPIVNSFMHAYLDDNSIIHNPEVFKWGDGTISLRDVGKLPKGTLQQVGTDYFKTYETLLASGMKLPVKELVNPTGGKHSLIPSVSETIFNKYLVQIDFLNKKDFKGIPDAAKIGEVIQDLYRNIFEQTDIPFVTSKGYFANLGIQTKEVVDVLEKDLVQIVKEIEKIETGEIFGEENKINFENLTWEKHLSQANTKKMMVRTSLNLGTQEAKRKLRYDPDTGYEYYEGGEFDVKKRKRNPELIKTEVMDEYMKRAKEIVPELDASKSIKSSHNLDILIKKGYLFAELPKSPGEFLQRMDIVLKESRVPTDILQDKPSVEKKIEGYGKRMMFNQYKTYVSELSKSPDFMKNVTEFPNLSQQLVPSPSTITTADLPGDMGMHILQSKEIQHGLPTGALSSGDIETGIRTAASLEFLKDLQSTATISTSDITKQAIQGDFYDQLKDALKLLVKKG
tara:strand:+ start:937 stop:3966 length:3030 start_codon:yes stop_codon:yes gene_type:complete